MKIISTGDWHLNAGYNEDVAGSLDQICKYAREKDIDLVAVTGDIYDRASEPESRNLAAQYIRSLAGSCDVRVIRGNHDALHDLVLFSSLESEYSIRVFENPDFEIWGDVMVHYLPWTTKARWQSFHPEATKEEGDATVSQMVLKFIKNQVLLNPGFKHVLVGHLTVAGAKCQAHQQMGADGITVGLYDLPESGLYAALLGHVHLRQLTGGERYFYNGSIAPLDYGESPDKWFSVLDTEEGSVKWVRLSTVYRYDVVAEWTPTGLTMTDIDPVLVKGSRVRVNLRVVGGDNVKAAKDAIEAWGLTVCALEVKINPQVIPVSKVRAVDISKSEKLSDKLKQYWSAVEEPDEATKADMLDKLEQLLEEI